MSLHSQFHCDRYGRAHATRRRRIHATCSRNPSSILYLYNSRGDQNTSYSLNSDRLRHTHAASLRSWAYLGSSRAGLIAAKSLVFRSTRRLDPESVCRICCPFATVRYRVGSGPEDTRSGNSQPLRFELPDCFRTGLPFVFPYKATMYIARYEQYAARR